MIVEEKEGPAARSGRTGDEPEAPEAIADRPPCKALIHVGLHRTGTTYLQTRMFPQIEGVRYAEKPSSREIEQLGAERHDRRPLLISHEGLLARKRDGVTRPGRLARLAVLFPDAVPVLTVRRHDRWVRSLYVYHLNKGDRRSFKTFLRDREPLTFMPHVRLLETFFGRPPLVLFQEELGEAPEATVQMLAGWMDRPLGPARRRRGRVNRGLSEAGLRWVLSLNRRFPRGDKAPPPCRWAQKLTRHLGAVAMSRMGAWSKSGGGGESETGEEALRAVRLQYRGDWIALLRHTAAQRQLLAGSLREELEDAAS